MFPIVVCSQTPIRASRVSTDTLKISTIGQPVSTPASGIKIYYERDTLRAKDSTGAVYKLTKISGTTPGGTTRQFQYNNAGSFGGTSGLEWMGSFPQVEFSGTGTNGFLIKKSAGTSGITFGADVREFVTFADTLDFQGAGGGTNNKMFSLYNDTGGDTGDSVLFRSQVRFNKYVHAYDSITIPLRPYNATTFNNSKRAMSEDTFRDWVVSAVFGAPVDATYITQTANSTLTNEQALSTLSTGIVKVTNGTGVLSTAAAGDFPTLNQTTTGSAGSLKMTGTTGLMTVTGVGAGTTREKTIRDANDTFLELGGSYTPTGTWNWGTATVTWPTFNQNTTGSSAKWTTARNLAGNSVDGSANVAFSNKFIVQGTADAGLSAAQFMGALATGIVKNTTTTGVLSIAVAGDFPTLNQNTTGTAQYATYPYVTNDDATASTMYPVWSAGTDGYNAMKTSSGKMTFNPSTATLTVANLTGNASTATTATNATNINTTNEISDTQTYPVFVNSLTGNQVPHTQGSGYLVYNASTGVLSAQGFSGPVTGNVTGNVSGTAGSLSAQYIDWNASSGGNSIANKPNLANYALLSGATFTGLVTLATGSSAGVAFGGGQEIFSNAANNLYYQSDTHTFLSSSGGTNYGAISSSGMNLTAGRYYSYNSANLMPDIAQDIYLNTGKLLYFGALGGTTRGHISVETASPYTAVWRSPNSGYDYFNMDGTTGEVRIYYPNTGGYPVLSVASTILTGTAEFRLNADGTTTQKFYVDNANGNTDSEGYVDAGTGFKYNGTAGIGASGGTTYNFNAASAGQVSSMTLRGGIVTAVSTYSPAPEPTPMSIIPDDEDNDIILGIVVLLLILACIKIVDLQKRVSRIENIINNKPHNNV